MKRATRPAHDGNLRLSKTFAEAYASLAAPTAFTTAAGTPFTAEAGFVKKGRRRGQQVIIFRSGRRERARAYACCWGHITNCNRTYIDAYSPVI